MVGVELLYVGNDITVSFKDWKFKCSGFIGLGMLLDLSNFVEMFVPSVFGRAWGPLDPGV